MPHWKPEHLQRLLSEKTPTEMFEHAIVLVNEAGLEHAGMNLSVHLATQHPHRYLYNNYPDPWNEHYQNDKCFLDRDPISHLCRASPQPVLWQEHLYDQAPEYRQLACSHGLRHGWTHSVHDQRHNESQFSVSRPKGQIGLREFYHKSARMLWLHSTLHSLITEHHLNKAAPVPTLTERELEVTKWTADGKTASDIATILSLSTSTVNFHIRSVITKLNVPNKTAAVAVAASLGLFWR